jgi:hypothetical protein
MKTCITILFVLVLVTSAAHARAQSANDAVGLSAQSSDVKAPSPDDPRWSAWLGCWTPAPAARTEADTQVCIVPAADGHGVRMLTFAGGVETLAETLVADGAPRTATENDCTGNRSTRWATTGARFFSTSSLRCAGQPELKSSGVAALIAANRWIDVRVVDSGGRQEVRTQRFWRSSSAPPPAVAAVVAALQPVREQPVPTTADDVIDASATLPAVAVEAWLAESNARVPVDRRTLVHLSDAHVGANVIDLMVALAFPRKFEVLRTSSSRGGGFGVGALDGYFGADWNALADIYGIGYGCFALPYCFGYGGYYPVGDWYEQPGGGGGGGEPVDTTHGQVVNGKGYTRVQVREPDHASSGSRSGSEGISTGGSSSDGGSASSSGSSGASPAGYSGGGGTSTGLTAVPR